jgi:FixJ family two-component response regulator
LERATGFEPITSMIGEHQVIQLVIRGLSYREIGRQLGVNESAVRKAYTRALKRIPPGEVVELRKLQSERLNDSRRRLFSELAGRRAGA